MDFIKRQYTYIPPPTASFTSQTAIVTGSNVGLGLEAARYFARLGAGKVIIACRSASKGAAARDDILATTSIDPSAVEVWNLDMGNWASIKAFAKRAAALDRLDAVIENAGIATQDYEVMEGFESTIAVNVVGTFLLALLLLPTLRKSGEKTGTVPHLTIVSSEVHEWAKFGEKHETSIFDAVNKNDAKYMADRYQVSKLLEVLSIRALATRMLESDRKSSRTPKPSVILNTVNPGLCHSSLTRSVTGPRALFMMAMKWVLARTTEVGGRTLIAGAAAGPESMGCYMSDTQVAEPSVWVRSEEGQKTQERVWKELGDILEGIEPGVLKNI